MTKSTTEKSICIREEDAIRLILEFLSNRDLCISQLSLERETGVYNCGDLNDDLIFLRQLILDGQWDDILQFVSPLEQSFQSSFDGRKFHFIIYKHKYVELLCIRSEANNPYQTIEIAVQDIIECLECLERYCSDRDEYTHLSSLLTLPNLNDDEELRNWNPNSWRLKCFNDIRPLVEPFMQSEGEKSKSTSSIAKNDRLMNLVFKGLQYELCINVILQKLNKIKVESIEPNVFNSIVNENDHMIDLYQCLNQATIDCLNQIFDAKNNSIQNKSETNNGLDSSRLSIAKHEKPALMASWSEMILSTPIKPKVFPHIDVPYRRIKASDLMSKSLNASLMNSTIIDTKDLMTMSVCDIAHFTASTLAATGFHLKINDGGDRRQPKPDPNAKSPLNEPEDKSIDRLFEHRSIINRCKPPLIIKPKSLKSNVENDDESSLSKMATISEKATPIDDVDYDVSSMVTIKMIEDNNCEQTIKTDEDHNNTSMMQTSYLKLWQQNAKSNPSSSNRPSSNTVSHRNNYRHSRRNNAGKNQSNLAEKYRNESKKLASHRQHSAAATNNNCLNKNEKKLAGVGVVGGVDRNNNNTHQQHENDDFDHPDMDNIAKGQIGLMMDNNQPNNLIQNHKSKYDGGGSNQSIEHGIHHRTSTPILPSNISERHHHDHSSLSSTALNEILAPNDNQAHIKFQPLITIYDQQAIRTGEFHPSGKYYAIGTNSKLLRIFRYENNTTNNQSSPENKSDNTPRSIQPNDIHTRNNYHRGSIYCLTWNKLGNLLATGSNDKIVKLLPFNQESGNCPTSEFEMNAHDGTIRDLCFMDDITNGSSLLLSAGAGDCKVYITDCETATPFLSLSGHSAPILSLYTWGGAMFVSGSQDRTIRFWDLRTNSCINFVTCPTISRNKPGGAVAAVCVDPSGKLLVSGHEDSTCMLYDMRGGRVIQTFHPHTADVRTIRFSNKAYYLLTGSYDNRIVLTDLQGDLTQPLQSIPIASHNDKVIQCRWNPNEFTFISTSADKSAIIWQLPPDDDHEQP